MTERTLMMIKPDAVQRSLVGKIITRIENKGLKIVGLKLIKLSSDEVDRLYDIHINKDFYPKLKEFILSGPVVAIAIEGKNAVSVVRTLAGVTNAVEAAPGTIRGDFGLHLTKNIVHTSDAAKRASYELNVLFKPEDIVEYNLMNEIWVQ
ncbi:MAG: nucleoside-diphosphate kinase [Candidatus Hodarchaeales archaeon]